MKSVPALFRSRVFRIWAGATLPSASSWMARFSVTGTFGGFPIVEPFRIVGQGGQTLAALVADRGAGPVCTHYPNEIGRQIERQLARLRLHSSWKAAHEFGGEGATPWTMLNEMILDWYGLPKDAQVTSPILKRLQELNATLD